MALWRDRFNPISASTNYVSTKKKESTAKLQYFRLPQRS